MGLLSPFAVKNLSVKLNNPSRVTKPLEYIKGVVSFTVTHPTDFRNVSVSVHGTETVKISDGEIYRFGSSSFLSSNVTLLGLSDAAPNDKSGLEAKQRSGVEETTETSNKTIYTPGVDANWKGVLPAGDYSFPVAFPIPAEALPTLAVSTTGCECTVEYFLEACVQCPFAFKRRSLCNFAVVRPMPAKQLLDQTVGTVAGDAANTPDATASTTAPLDGTRYRFYHLLSQGSTKGILELAQNVVIFGEEAASEGAPSTLHGFITLDNTESQQPITAVRVALVQQIDLSDNQSSNEVLTLEMSHIELKMNVPAGGTQESNTTPASASTAASVASNDASSPHRLPFELPVRSENHGIADEANGGFPLFHPDMIATKVPRAASYRGACSRNRYFVRVSVDGDCIGQAEVVASTTVDSTDKCELVQSSVDKTTSYEQPSWLLKSSISDILGKKAVPGAQYLYTPPPGMGSPTIPATKDDIGPIALSSSTTHIRYD